MWYTKKKWFDSSILSKYLKYLMKKAIYSCWKEFVFLGNIIKHSLNHRDWLCRISAQIFIPDILEAKLYFLQISTEK